MKKSSPYSILLLLCFLLCGPMVSGQTAHLSGKVTDAEGNPLSGASVHIVNRGLSGTTDTSGRYEFAEISPGALSISAQYAGYKAQEKTVQLISSSQVQVDFMLEAGGREAEKGIFIGYGVQEKTGFTGAVSTLGPGDFQKQQHSSPEALIAGKAPGVSITSNGGAPGAGSQLSIRGGASLRASDPPLIVLDGMPLTSGPVTGISHPLALINPDDIQRITILKDATAAAIYGARASGGVMLISTKKGGPEKAAVHFSSEYSIGWVPRMAEVFSPGAFRSFLEDEGGPAFSHLMGGAETDWQRAIYQTASATDNNLSLSGSLKNMPYRIAINYLNQQGVLKTDALERSSVSLNLHPSLFNDHLKVHLNLRAARGNTRFANPHAIINAIRFDPTQPLRVSDDRFGGFFEWEDPMEPGTPNLLAPRNPLALLELNDDRGKALRSIGNLHLDYALPTLSDLHLNLNLGYDVSKGERSRFVPENAASHYQRYQDGQGMLHSGLNALNKQRRNNQLLEFYLDYSRDLAGGDSRLDAVAGYAYQNYSTRYDYFPDRTADGTQVTLPALPFEEYAHHLSSFFARVGYAYLNRYMLNVSVRSDKSSRLQPGETWAVFPAASLAWRLRQEQFLKDHPVISELKLRLGYGVTGGANFPGIYPMADPGSENNPAERADAWEEKQEQTSSGNLGVDFGLWNNRLSGSLDIYHKKTENIRNYFPGADFPRMYLAGIADMQQTGVELDLLGRLLEKNALSWDLNLNLTYQTNKITRLSTVSGDVEFPYQYGITGSGMSALANAEGYPRSSFYVYQQVYDRTGRPIDGVFVDRDPDDEINARDRHFYKSAEPRVFLGLSSMVSYRRWSAGFTARASLGNYVYNRLFAYSGTLSAMMPQGGYLNNGTSEVLLSGFSGSTARTRLSDYYIENGSFLRLDDLHLAYHAGTVFGQSGDLTLRAGMQNLFLLTRYKGTDPEIPGGVDYNFYPRPQRFTLGLDLQF